MVTCMQAAHLLLEYCMADLDISRPESLQQLAGLQLIPTVGGSITSLQNSNALRPRPLFLATRLQQEVLVSARDALVSCEVSSRAQRFAMELFCCVDPI